MRLIIALLWMAFLLGVLGKSALPQQYPNCEQFGFSIPTACCCTANCCSEADAGEFTHVVRNEYRSNVTGQVVQRTGWSPDGRTVKCACDNVNGTWVKHPNARVHCLFTPMPSS